VLAHASMSNGFSFCISLPPKCGTIWFSTSSR
jgi:hypothetical protein